MALYTIKDVKAFLAEQAGEPYVEIYYPVSNGYRNPFHTDNLDFVDASLHEFDDTRGVIAFELMDYQDYNSSVEANGEPFYKTPEQFEAECPDGILCVLLERLKSDLLDS